MNVRNNPSKFWLLVAAMVVVFCSTTAVGFAEVKPNNPGGAALNNPNPFTIYSLCPPAVCVGQWNGLDDAAGGNTDFTPIRIPIQFSFYTANPLTWSCNQQGDTCQATYGPGGSFTMTGPAGTFTGIVTSGAAFQNANRVVISVTFSGQWSNGQHMTGDAFERYTDQNGRPDTELNMHPAP